MKKKKKSLSVIVASGPFMKINSEVMSRGGFNECRLNILEEIDRNGGFQDNFTESIFH